MGTVGSGGRMGARSHPDERGAPWSLAPGRPPPPLLREGGGRGSGGRRYLRADFITVRMWRVSISSSERPFVSGTNMKTKTNDIAANAAYRP
ncbi:hypothetical protein ACH61_01676 [Rathayibacter tanaceti]|uniref:Uncharacterized protein n=1 Tax=Rathayibacter tanaceti TaxID=1671680 RepID=A0A166HV70_9MICO|nr:hypothetical protein ACH61_01676 [Rathayibacter tanaceti]